MIHEVDESLRALILAGANGQGVEVTFEAPTKEWASRQNSPSIDCFLYDIREDLSRRNVGPILIRDDDGIVIGRKPPPRKFRLSYLLTAWTQRPEDEHRLLTTLMQTFLAHDEIPQEHLVGQLADQREAVSYSLALPPSQDRSLSDIWSALGGELKPSLDLQVITPISPDRSFETGPPALEEPRISITNSRTGSPVHRAPTEPIEDRAGAERIQMGTDDRPGRTFEMANLNEAEER